MTTLAHFKELHNSARYTPYPDRKMWRNLVAQRNYIVDWFMGGESKKRFQGGLGIEFRDMVNIGGGGLGTAQTAVPGTPLALNKMNKTTNRKAGWRYIVDNDTISEQELLHSGHAPAEDQLLDMLEVIEERFALSLIGKWEQTLAALPLASSQDADGAQDPMSIFSFITEDPGGVHPNWGASTVQGYDPALIPNGGWDNKRVTYARTSHTAGTGRVLSGALSQAVRYAKMPVVPFGHENSMRQAVAGVGKIGCSDQGYRQYEASTIEQSHDPFRTSSVQDQIPGNLRVKGLDFMVWDGFETAEVYEDAAGGGYTTEELANGASTYYGPRYYGLNRDVLYPMVHEEHYFKKLPLRDIANMPFDYVMWRTLWTNLICEDRRGLFVVHPSANIPLL